MPLLLLTVSYVDSRLSTSFSAEVVPLLLLTVSYVDSRLSTSFSAEVLPLLRLAVLFELLKTVYIFLCRRFAFVTIDRDVRVTQDNLSVSRQNVMYLFRLTVLCE